MVTAPYALRFNGPEGVIEKMLMQYLGLIIFVGIYIKISEIWQLGNREEKILGF